VSVLPVTFFVSLLIISISFVTTLNQEKPNEYVLFVHILLLIFILHGTPQVVYGTLRYSWAWKHLGIVDYIQRHGSVNPTIFNLNAYHNWPGFFALAAFYNQVAGLQSSLPYAGWGPFFFNLLDMGALLLIFKSLSIDKRLAWLAVWFFFLFSWIGQDYFSPQAFAYFLYLITFAVLLRFFRNRKITSMIFLQKLLRIRWIARLYDTVVARSILDSKPPVKTGAGQRVMLMVILILILAVIASSHQLTPVMLISGLAMLVLFQVTNQRTVPLLMVVITTAWIIFMAIGFLEGNVSWIIKSIGSLLDNVTSNLIDLNTASTGQQIIAKVDRLLSIFAWILAVFGIIRRLRSRSWDLPALLLAVSPLPILAFNAYGGEMLFRVYLFSLPGIMFFAAGLFYPNLKAGTSKLTPIFTTIVTLLIIPGFLYSYYGKERMYYFSPNEVAAAQFVYTIAPEGAMIVDSTWDWPRQSTNYEYYNYLSLVRLPKADREKIINDPVAMLSNIMGKSAPQMVNLYGSESGSQPGALIGKSIPNSYSAAFFVITRSQMAEGEMTGSLPDNWFPTIVSALSQSADFRLIYQNDDASVFEYLHPQGK
jgi:hypothetical protein